MIGRIVGFAEEKFHSDSEGDVHQTDRTWRNTKDSDLSKIESSLSHLG